jgi:hypothetical protein
MPRLILASVAALLLGVAAASAQDSGGVVLTPEIMGMDNAQGKVLDHVLGRLQQLQQLRQQNLSGGAVTSSNAANPANAAPPNTAPQAAGNAGGGLSLASILRRQALAASDPPVQVFNTTEALTVNNSLTVNKSQSLTVNKSHTLAIDAHDSPVTIGNDNIVRQQVTSSTASSVNGPATATAAASSGAGSKGDRRRAPANSASTTQSAVSTAISQGGTAHAAAINSDVTPQGNR